MTAEPVRRLVAPCTRGCPAGLDIPRYIGFIARGDYRASLATVRERMPLPDICGRVCYHPCEDMCRRARLDKPIAINALKRFASQFDDGSWKARARMSPSTGKRVAVVGSGPGGFTAAYYLAKQGHQVTLFEALPYLGGMMRTGIPPYRLPRSVLDREMAQLGEVGVEVKVDSLVESVDDLFAQDYHAVFLALGAHVGMKLMIEGEDLPQVSDAVTFLRARNLGDEIRVGRKVVVVGGGCVAVDGARSALRLGARDVSILYRRTRAECPAHSKDIEDALFEGIKLDILMTPSRIARQDTGLAIEAIRMQLGEPDASGRPAPVPVPGSESIIEADNLLVAVGQRPHLPSRLGVVPTRYGTLEVDQATLATSRPGVFAGGDVVLGPASFVEAIAHGRQAATSIDRYLGGLEAWDEALASPAPMEARDLDQITEEDRVPLPTLPLEQRQRDFAEVELGFSEEEARREALRCLRCDIWRLKVPPIWERRTKGKRAE